MSKEEKRAPEVRFEGFNDDWKQRKFDELVNRINKRTDEVDLPRVEFEDITSGQGQLNKDVYEKQSDKAGLEFKPGDILFGKLRPYLKKWLYTNFKGIAVGDFWILRPNKVENIFIYFLIQTPKYQFIANLTSGTKMPRSDWKTVSNTTFSIPSQYKEQNKIGIYLKKIDDTITLHQEKLNKLQELKKTTLQTLFPKRDEKIPKVRFTNFNELWKKHKLKDNTEMYDNLRIPVTKSERVHGNIPYYGANGIQDYVNNYTHDGEYVLIAEDGATDLINYPVNYIKGKAWVNNHAHVLSGRENRLDNLFLHARLKTMNISAWLVGGSRAKLNGGVLRELPLVVPAFVEQQKIGNFFQQLDNSITLYQSKLEKLQTLKKVFLQKMFI